MSASVQSLPVTSLSTLKFKNILCATDFSEPSKKALYYAGEIARKFGASLYLCHVVTPTPLAIGAPEAAPYLYKAEIENGATGLEELAHAPQLQALEVTTLMPSGPLADEIVRVIEENDIDLVVSGTHGRSGLSRLILGSSAEEICRVASRPVLTIGPDLEAGHKVEFKHILFPTDMSEESAKAVPYIVLLAEAYGARVTVLHVLPEETGTNPDARDLAEPVRQSIVHTFEKAFGNLKAEFVIEFGDTAKTVLESAFRCNADLIAMGIRNTFLPEIQLRSSLAYRLIVGAGCPVLTCR